MNIEENNKLIAEYVQIEYKEILYKTGSSGDKYYHINDIPMLNDSCHCYPADENDYQFHLSWDWLMPVVEKIWSYIDNRESLFYFTNDDCDIVMVSDGLNNQKDCYLAVVEFINWYNKQQ